MKVNNMTCTVGEYLPLRRELENIGYILGPGQIHFEFVKHGTKYKAGKIGTKKCFQLLHLQFYCKFEVIYNPNLVGGGKVTPPTFY